MAEKLAKPLGDRVLLTEVDVQTEKTVGGIIIPDSVRQEDVKRAKVEAVGDGLFTQAGVPIPMSLKVGDEVIFSQHAFAVYSLVTQAMGAVGVKVPAHNFSHDLTKMFEPRISTI